MAILDTLLQGFAHGVVGYLGVKGYREASTSARAGAEVANKGLDALARISAEQRGMQRTAFEVNQANREEALATWEKIKSAIGDMHDPQTTALAQGIYRYLLGGGDPSLINVPGFQRQLETIDEVARNNILYTTARIREAGDLEVQTLLRSVPYESGGARMRLLAYAAEKTKDKEAEAKATIAADAAKTKRDFMITWQKELTNKALEYGQQGPKDVATALNAGMNLPSVQAPTLDTAAAQAYMNYGTQTLSDAGKTKGGLTNLGIQALLDMTKKEKEPQFKFVFGDEQPTKTLAKEPDRLVKLRPWEVGL